MKVLMILALLGSTLWFGLIGAQAAEIKKVEVYVNGERVEKNIELGFGVSVDIGTMTQFLAAGDEIAIRVTVKGRDEIVWIGATLRDGQGDEQDLPARGLKFEGRDTKNQVLATDLADYLEDPVNWNQDGIHYMVALWRGRVRDDSHEFGYVMRGRIEDTGWQLLGFYNPW